MQSQALLEVERAKWEREFADQDPDDPNYSWATITPLALEMFFEKTRNKTIPINIPSITSMISRFIENNLDEKTLREILEFCKSLDITGPLYLRRVRNVEYLSLAASYGFHDPELTKRIVLLQRLHRKEELPTITFEGRKPGESPIYFGYRHAMYFARYDRKHRLDIFKHTNWGGCNWQGYADCVGDELDKEVCEAVKRRVTK